MFQEGLRDAHKYQTAQNESSTKVYEMYTNTKTAQNERNECSRKDNEMLHKYQTVRKEWKLLTSITYYLLENAYLFHCQSRLLCCWRPQSVCTPGRLPLDRTLDTKYVKTGECLLSITCHHAESCPPKHHQPNNSFPDFCNVNRLADIYRSAWPYVFQTVFLDYMAICISDCISRLHGHMYFRLYFLNTWPYVFQTVFLDYMAICISDCISRLHGHMYFRLYF